MFGFISRKKVIKAIEHIVNEVYGTRVEYYEKQEGER